jgi:hypothetical protein
MGKYSIIGPGYQGRSNNVNSSRCINFYPELNSQDSKSVSSLIGTPGLLLIIDTLLGSIRGAHFFNEKIYFVSANKLYYLNAGYALFPALDNLGAHVTIGTTEGRVVMADNGMYSVGGAVANQLAFVDGQNIYVYNVTTSVISSQAISAKTICFIGGYFMADTGGAGFAISALYEGTLPWAALAVSTADTYPDNLQAIVNNHNEAWLIGEYSTEIWPADGSANPMPFSRMAVIDYGTKAPYSIAKGANTIFGLFSERNGNSGELYGIGLVEGYGVKIVSPQAINTHLSKYSEVSDAWGYCYTDKGHEFYVLTFPTENATWVYDVTTNLCHERSYYSGNPYKINRHIANAYVYAWGKHFIGSYIDGKVYEMSESYYDDDGVPIASVRIAPPIDDENNIFISKLQLDAETGVGDTSVTPYTDFSIAVDLNPFGIVAGFDYIWVANESGGTISKINPITKAVVATITPGGGFTGSGIACCTSYVWVCDSNNNRVLKINPLTNAIETIVAVGVIPLGITYGGGYIWVVNNWDETFTKIDPVTDAVVFTRGLGNDPKMPCYAFDLLWVSNVGFNTLRSYDPTTGVMVSNIAVGVAPYMTAAGFGYIWTVDAGPPSTISKVDPATNLMVHNFALPTECECIVCTRSSIWASGSGGFLYRINPVTYAIETVLAGLPDPLDIALRTTDEGKESLWISGITDTYITALFLDLDKYSVDPQALLSWSVDGGHTWSNDHSTSMGKLGQYLTRMIWRRLGAARNRTFRVAVTAAVKKVLIGCYMDFEKGMY